MTALQLAASEYGIGPPVAILHGLFREHPELRDGHLIVGDKPGFGLDPDWGFVDKYRLK